MLWTGVRGPPPPKLGPPKTLGPPTHRDSRGPPTKLHGHVKGNKVPSRETSHSLLGNSHLCSVFCTTECREQSNYLRRKGNGAQRQKFLNSVAQMAENCLKINQFNRVYRSAPNDCNIYGGPPTVGGPPTFSQNF